MSCEQVWESVAVFSMLFWMRHVAYSLFCCSDNSNAFMILLFKEAILIQQLNTNSNNGGRYASDELRIKCWVRTQFTVSNQWYFYPVDFIDAGKCIDYTSCPGYHFCIFMITEVCLFDQQKVMSHYSHLLAETVFFSAYCFFNTFICVFCVL